MAKDRFSICHAITAKWEGGWSDHPNDPGGRTMYGITEAVYHAWLGSKGRPYRPVRNISMAEALQIYREQFWKPTAERYNLVPGVDLAVYDAGVNSGVSRAIRWLSQGADKANRHAETVKNICRLRLSFKQGLAIFKTFGRGWTNRVTDIEARGVKMALEYSQEEIEVRERLEHESRKADRTSKEQAGGAAGAGGGAGAGSQVEPTTVAPEQAAELAGWLLAGGIAFLALLAGFLVWRAYVNHTRAKAYERVMEGEH